MRFRRYFLYIPFVLFPFILTLSSFLLPQQEREPVREIVIRAISGLQYDSVRFQLSPGETVKITLLNADEMAHNMVVTAKGKREEIVAQALKMGAEGQDKNFVPDSEWILASTPILKPEGSFSFNFTAPKEEGVYPYVCTYPGHGAVMYGAIYVTKNKMPPLATDTNIPPQRRENSQTSQKMPDHPYPDQFPKMYRTFLPDTGPASIAVAMNEQLSYCWDAGSCRFRYLWKGGFLNMAPTWGGKGKERAEIVGKVFYREEEEAPFRIGQKDHKPTADFVGYRMDNKLPTFMYNLDGVEVSERITPSLEKAGIKRQLSFKNLKEPIWFVKPSGANIEVYVNKGVWEGNYLKLSPEEAQDFTITITEKKPEI